MKCSRTDSARSRRVGRCSGDGACPFGLVDDKLEFACSQTRPQSQYFEGSGWGMITFSSTVVFLLTPFNTTF
jgi:hypothetical protein